jgi:hypothetical protein
MLKQTTTAVAVILIGLLGARDAGACDKEKRGQGHHAAQGDGQHDKNSEVLARGEQAEVVGTVFCPSCEAGKKGHCSVALRDANGATYALTGNRTTHAIHTMAAHKATIEVRGRKLRENGTAYLSPTSFRFVTAAAATSTEPSAPAAEPVVPKKEKGCCKD